MGRPTTPPADNPPADVDAEAATPAPADAPALVAEGTRQELLGGGRAYDYATGRELILEGASNPTRDGDPGSPGRVRFKTDAELAAADDAPAGRISSGDVASLNPT
jgi:hypothetical protein